MLKKRLRVKKLKDIGAKGAKGASTSRSILRKKQKKNRLITKKGEEEEEGEEDKDKLKYFQQLN